MFVYPVGSVTIITIILVIIELTLCVSEKRRRNNLTGRYLRSNKHDCKYKYREN